MNYSPQKELFDKNLAQNGKDIKISDEDAKGLIRHIKDNDNDRFLRQFVTAYPIKHFDKVTIEDKDYLAKVVEQYDYYFKCIIYPVFHTINVKYTNTDLMEFDVIAEDKIPLIDIGTSVNTLNGKVELLLKHTRQSELIQTNTRFFLYNNVFKVINVTWEKYDILRVYAEIDLIDVADDKINKIAKNKEIEIPKVYYTLKATTDKNGIVEPLESVIEEGKSQTWTITPNQNYNVDKIYLDEIEQTITGNEFTLDNVKSNHTLNVTFKELAKYKITTIAKGGNGTITPTLEVYEGTNPTFKLSPNEGYMVDKVLLDNVNIQALNNEVIISNVQANHEIVVTFKEIPIVKYKVTTSTDGNGTITPDTITLDSGKSQTFTITPNADYEIDTLLLNGSQVVVENNQYTISNISQDYELKATFKANKQVVSFSATDGYNKPIDLTKPIKILQNFSVETKVIKLINGIPTTELLHIEDVSTNIPQGYYTLTLVNNSFTVKNLKMYNKAKVKIKISDNKGNETIANITLGGAF